MNTGYGNILRKRKKKEGREGGRKLGRKKVSLDVTGYYLQDTKHIPRRFAGGKHDAPPDKRLGFDVVKDAAEN